MKHKVKLAVLLALVAMLLIATPVLAIIYQATYTVSENGTASYDMLGVMRASNNQWMADNGFFNSTANDTRIETLGGLEKPHMVTDNMTLTAIPVPTGSQTNLYFSTGDSELDDFYIIVGYSANTSVGYISVTDNTSIELGDNFTVTQTGWVQTTFASGNYSDRNLVYKEDAFRTYISGSGNITSAIVATAPETLRPDGAGDEETIAFGSSGAGNHWQDVNEDPIDDATFVAQTANVYKRDLYQSANTSIGGGAIEQVEIFTRGKSEGAADTWLKTAIKTGGTAYDGIEVTMPSAVWVNYSTVYIDNPKTGVAWTWADIDALQIGVSLKAGVAHNAYCSAVWIEVSYELAVTATGVSSDNHTIKTELQDVSANISQLASSTAGVLRNGGNTRYGERLNSFPMSSITEIRFQLWKSGLPTGTANVTARKVSDDSLLGIIGTIDVTTITPASPSWYAFNTTPINVPATQDIRIAIEYNDGDAVNLIRIQYQGTDVYAGGVLTYYNAGWTDLGALDTAFEILYSELRLIISIDGEEEDSIHAGGISVPPNSENWALLQNNVMPYCESMTFEIDGVTELYFDPTAIISGTTLPDRGGAPANDGTFHWGANPSGVSVALGSMVSSSQPAPGAGEETPTQDILPEVEVTDWFLDPDVHGTLLTNPLRPFVTIMSDTTTLTELQAWRLLGLAFCLFVTVLTAVNVRGHQGITGIAMGAAIGLLVAWTIFPMWALVFAIGGVVFGLIAERSPSL